jgi:hypothetical protein
MTSQHVMTPQHVPPVFSLIVDEPHLLLQQPILDSTPVLSLTKVFSFPLLVIIIIII